MSQQVNDNFQLLAGLPIEDRIKKSTIAERDAISPTRRFQGLQCFVDQTQTLYLLMGGVTNSNWVGIAGGNLQSGIETVIEGFYVLSAGKTNQLDWEVDDKFRGWIGDRYVVGDIVSLPVSLPSDIDNPAKVFLAFDSDTSDPDNFVEKVGEDFIYSTDFDPLLSQDPINLTIKKRDLAPELSRLNPTIIPIYAWGDSLTAPYLAPPFPIPYPTILTGQLGYTVTNKGVGGETSTQIKNRLVADTANYSKSVIIWAGRNNLTDPTTVKADIATMISTIGHTRYLVVSILNASDEGIGTLRYTQVTTLNNDLKAIYGSKFVSVREYLVSKYNPSVPQDVTDHTNDVIPSTLRLDSIHLNETGNTYVSEYLFQRLGNLYNQTGYLQGKDVEGYLQNSASVIHTTGNETKAGVLTLSSSPIISSETASTIASFDATKNLKSLSTATYPSLTELSYVKGVTSAIQTQLNGKQAALTNPVTGTGVSGQVAFWTGTNIQSGDSNLQWDNTNKRLGINVFSTPQSRLDVRAEGTERLFGITLYSNTLSSGATMIGTRIGGTKASNSAILANSLMTSIQTTGHNGVGSGNITGRIDIFSKQDFTTINESTYMTFSTSPIGGIIAVERLRIDSDGRALFGTTTNNGVDQVQVTGTISATVDATTSSQLVRKGQMDLAISASRPYKVYTAIINQTGTSAPTAVIMENTLGGTVVWARSATGLYSGTLTGAFTASKTWIMVGNNSNLNNDLLVVASRGDNNFVNLTSRLNISATDGIITDLHIEIRVYN